MQTASKQRGQRFSRTPLVFFYSKIFLFLFIVGICAVWTLVDSQLDDNSVHSRRFLEDVVTTTTTEDPCPDPKTVIPFADPTADGNGAFMIFYVMGVFYMFIALAIVCDEYFVPSLEVISDELELSPDISGATLMAAGGSAPELFTSGIGTFQESDVGFGAIVGSAVFNVLFVIGMCAFFAEEELQLTWWPLARDCTYYCLGLIVLSIVFTAISDGEIYVWEAAILFAGYLGYVTLMYYNQSLHAWVVKKLGLDENHEKNQHSTEITFNKPSTFRAGILSLLINEKSIWDTIPYRIVTEIKGDLEETFKTFDINGDGNIDNEEMRKVFRDLKFNYTDEMADEIFKELDTNENSMVSFEEFMKWYVGSEKRIEREMQMIFSRFDHNQDGTINHTEIRELLIASGVQHSEADEAKKTLQRMSTLANIDAKTGLKRDPSVSSLAQKQKTADDLAHEVFEEVLDDVSGGKEFDGGNVELQDVDKDASVDKNDRSFDEQFAGAVEKFDTQRHQNESITFEVFKEWYQTQVFNAKIQDAKEEAEHAVSLSDLLSWPEKSGCIGKFWFVIVWPLMIMFYFTIPDTRAYNRTTLKWAMSSFGMSIFWIGAFSIFMVDWTILIGFFFGIPDVVMGVTFLAAGTSIPDLLSSVIVAKKGFGDMAVSSSIGSNIFDILVGLPVPWLVYGLINEKVVVESDNLPRSILVLLGMVMAVILLIIYSKWKMTKKLGMFMFGLYVVFLIQDLAFADWGCLG